VLKSYVSMKNIGIEIDGSYPIAAPSGVLNTAG
jgi:hypothetical protein